MILYHLSLDKSDRSSPMVDQRPSMVDSMNRSSMVNSMNWSSMVDSMNRSRSIGLWLRHIFLGNSLILNIRHKSILMISMIGHYLNPTIRQLHPVLTLDNTSSILSFCLCKVAAISISTSILIGKRLRCLFLYIGSRVVRSRGRGRVIRSRSWMVRRGQLGCKGGAKE